MNRFNRPEAHPAFTELGPKWTTNLLNKKVRNNKASFKWPKYNGLPINQIVLPVLLAATKQHCAYCDVFPLKKSDETIDHFKPKSKFPEDAYVWGNLFPACNSCQRSKMEQYSDLLINPEADDFSFYRFFEIDFASGRIRPSTVSSREDQLRAEITIAMFRLNDPGHEKSRVFYKSKYNSTTDIIDDLPYRYMFI